jgi:hypothetical protein
LVSFKKLAKGGHFSISGGSQMHPTFKKVLIVVAIALVAVVINRKTGIADTILSKVGL